MAVILPPEQLPELLQIMLRHPASRSHMLFLGPPGSSKTTTAQSFATALHGQTTNSFSSLLFLNSSDERSLETMRQKVYPFIESRMQSLFFMDSEPPPKVIIFDEAETLTDQAQCALRPLLQRSTKEVILIFICNSLSHIHEEILNKFLVIPFVPTGTKNLKAILGNDVPRFDSLFRRGDIRFFKQCWNERSIITDFLFHILHAQTEDEVYSLFLAPGSPLRERVSWFLLFFQNLTPLTSEEVSLWSAVSASETQTFLDETILKNILGRLWREKIATLPT